MRGSFPGDSPISTQHIDKKLIQKKDTHIKNLGEINLRLVFMGYGSFCFLQKKIIDDAMCEFSFYSPETERISLESFAHP